MSEDEFSPDESEVVQSEAPAVDAVAVIVKAPVETRRLPSKWADHSSFNLDLTATDGTEVYRFNENPNRSVLTIIAKTNPIIHATSRGGLRAGAEWPVGVPLVITHRKEVWVTPQTAQAKISWVEESWN